MKKYIPCFFIFIMVYFTQLTLANSGQGQKKLAVLIAFDEEELKGNTCFSYFYDLEKLLNNLRKKAGYYNLNVTVIYKAVEHNINRIIIDNNTIALFWISHANNLLQEMKGLTVYPQIYDYENHNVMETLQEIKLKSSIKHISLITCYSNQYRKYFEDDSHDVGFYGFNGKITPYTGLKNAINYFFKYVLNRSLILNGRSYDEEKNY